MSLRTSLTRRLAGPPPRAGQMAPRQTWLTDPHTILREGGGTAMPRRPGPAHPVQTSAVQGWPDHVFDDRASLDRLPGALGESRIDLKASSPGVLIRQPRRPAAIAPEPGQTRPVADPAAPSVRYTRTPDPVLHERRQRALDAERLAQAEAEALRELQRLAAEETEALRQESLRQEVLRQEAMRQEASCAEAAAPSSSRHQPFVMPPDVRFFRSPDRRPAPAAAPRPAAPAPHAPADAPDWAQVPDWSDLRSWFDGRDWPALEAWSAIQDESRAPTAQAAAPLVTAPMPATPIASIVASPVPAAVPHLAAVPPAPIYVLDRLMRFEPARVPSPADGQDNAALTHRPPAPGFAGLPPTLGAMAARAAIRQGRARPQAPSVALPAEPAIVAFVAPPVSAPVPAPVAPPAPAPAPVAIPPRPVLLRTPKAVLPMPEEADEVDAIALDEIVEVEPDEPEAPVPSPVVVTAPVQRVVMPEPRATLIPAGRHVPMAAFENADYEHPSLELLAEPAESGAEEVDSDVLEQNALNLQQTVQDFGVRGDILAVRPGPVVTLYELEPAPGTKSSRVIGLSDDIARSMSAVSARVAVVPGRNVIGIELPNETRETVYLRELLASADFGTSKHKLALCLGKN
ncbi:DNA translocase FtsK, partial [Methylobacterium iners]|uniref:DNA translocase FtsK n=1 Tax=Methylobacterium iners TaxID=418707 RepID=UPI0024B6028B